MGVDLYFVFCLYLCLLKSKLFGQYLCKVANLEYCKGNQTKKKLNLNGRV